MWSYLPVKVGGSFSKESNALRNKISLCCAVFLSETSNFAGNYETNIAA
jgi:hypothetical protein